jgi:FixJ family two-component response regulator
MDQAAPTNPVITIIEDDAAIRESLKLLLEIRGYDVDVFSSGDELLANLDFAQCACLIFDVNLPGRNGFEVVADLRKRGVTTPVIFMSGRATPAMRAQAQKVDAVAFFDKPVRPEDLLASIAEVAARK